MSVESVEPAEEIKRLQRCINDLVSVLALPAMWSGTEPPQIAHTLLEALLRMLQLDLVYIHLKNPGGDAAIEVVQFADAQNQSAPPNEIGDVFRQWLGADPHKWPALTRSRLGNREITIVPLGLGLQGEMGAIIAGAERADFPQQTERLILSVAANQASIGLQEARLLGEQRRIASELDRRVAQRTTELAAANEELRKEIAERSEIEKRLLENETLLKQSEARLWELIDTIPVIAWFCLPDGANEFHNKRWTEYTGLSPDESTGSGWRFAYHPEDLPHLIQRRQEYMSSGERGEIQARIRRFDGVYRWFLIRAEPFRDESGKILRWYGTCTDIHDRKVMQEELQESEGKHRVVVETASDAVVSMDASGAIILANPATKRIFGYDPAELIGRPLALLMPAALRQSHDHGFKRYVATGQRRINWQGTELTGLRKDGQEFPVEVSFGELTRSGQKVFTGFIRDISERKRAEEALRVSERDLSLIIETIPGLVWCAAPDGELNYLNQRLLEYTGTSSGDWAELGWANFLHPQDVEATVSAWSRAVATGQPHDTQCRLRRADGVYRWFHTLGQGARDNEGRVTRWYGLLIDIDDQKNVEEALRGSEMRLSRATRTATVGEFAASIAHEINQPLAAVVANGHACLRWLSAGPEGLSKAQEAAERIIRDGNESAEVVRRIRALFKKATIDKIELELNEVIAEVLRLLSDEAAKRRVTVEMDLANDLPLVVGDRVQLQQLTFNLLLNGIEAMDPVLDRPRKLHIRSKRHDAEAVLVEIRDSGVGIEDPEKVFEAFFTTKENGMGMGLSVCRSIVDAHHGRLWAASGSGEGTTFSFTLPIQAGAAL